MSQAPPTKSNMNEENSPSSTKRITISFWQKKSIQSQEETTLTNLPSPETITEFPEGKALGIKKLR